ncbi:hypothetical protein JCM8547_007316 [Rhodosporidiobolus lusitaniae]
MSTPSKESPFGRLVRSLSRSRSSPKAERPPRQRSSSRGRNLEDAGKYSPKDVYGAPLASPSTAALSTSPPPDSYFPRPPSAVLRDDEASGLQRHPESVGARAFDVGGSDEGQSAAPGVSFAPSTGGERKRPDSELEGWAPAPRRSNSQRVRRQPSANGGLSRTRSRKDKDNKENGPPPVPSPPLDGKVQVGDRVVNAGERKGVQLEDKPLSRSTSVKRVASAFKRAGKAFEPPPKEEGEKRVLILVADGSEEIEVFTAQDVFVRASLSPCLASVSPQFSPSHSLSHITLSRGAKILADTTFETVKEEHKNDFDAVYVPGGAKGAERLAKDPDVQQLLWTFHEAGKLVACICAGSLAAKSAGIGLGGRITSHPSVKGDLEKHYDYSEERVCVDGNLVSSRGPGTALEHTLKVVEILLGKAKRDEVAEPMLVGF